MDSAVFRRTDRSSPTSCGRSSGRGRSCGVILRHDVLRTVHRRSTTAGRGEQARDRRTGWWPDFNAIAVNPGAAVQARAGAFEFTLAWRGALFEHVHMHIYMRIYTYACVYKCWAGFLIVFWIRTAKVPGCRQRSFHWCISPRLRDERPPMYMHMIGFF